MSDQYARYVAFRKGSGAEFVLRNLASLEGGSLDYAFFLGSGLVALIQNVERTEKYAGD